MLDKELAVELSPYIQCPFLIMSWFVKKSKKLGVKYNTEFTKFEARQIVDNPDLYFGFDFKKGGIKINRYGEALQMSLSNNQSHLKTRTFMIPEQWKEALEEIKYLSIHKYIK